MIKVWMSGALTYIDSHKMINPVPSFGLGICMKSNSNKWKEGIMRIIN